MTPADKAIVPQWEKALLGEIVTVLDSQRVPVNAAERSNRPGRIPYYGATGQVGWIDDYLFDEALVLLGEDGAPFLEPGKGVSYLIRGKSWVNNHAHVLRTLGEIPGAFLCYQLNQVEYAPFVSGTTRLKLPQAPMKRIPLVLPPLREQHRIVDAVDSLFTKLDAAVAALERVRANLKRYRASVLKSAVEGRLVPTEAELARKEGRDYEPASVLLNRILVERRRRWEESELARMKAAGKPPKDDRWKAKYKEPVAPDTNALPQLPEGWCWATCNQIAWSAGYGTSVKCREDNDGLAVLRIPNISGGTLDLRHLKFAPKRYAENEDALVGLGDLLLIRTNGSQTLIGRGAVMRNKPTSRFAFASYLIRLRLVPLPVVLDWAAVVWESPYVRQWIESRAASSAGQFNISLRVLEKLAVPLPPEAEQRRSALEVERLLSIVQSSSVACDLAMTRSQRLRQSILKWAFEGKLIDQNPNDEPACVLLERIRAARAATASSRKSRKPNTHAAEAAK